MTPDPQDKHPIDSRQWERLETLLPAVLALPVDARRAFLDRECRGDAVLRRELDALLAAHESTGPLDNPIASPTAGSPSPEATLPVNSIISHFQILELLGSGGMGVVYRARDLRLERNVALKFLSPALGRDEKAKRRFLTEARAAATLEHANICTVHEIDETADGRIFIALALVDGQSLKEMLEHGPLPLWQAVEIASQIAAGLERAHSRGIVHRDIKPANVMVGADGVVKLVDFGVAKLAGADLTNTGVTPGTVAYMSPEQARGEEVDPRTDLWALGVVLYEMLAGQRPFGGHTEAVVLFRITSSNPSPVEGLRPGIPPELAELVERALTKDRDHRFGSAGEMRAALRQLGQRVVRPVAPPQSAAAEATDHPARTRGAWLRRSNIRKRVMIGVGVAAALAAGAGSYTWLVSARSGSAATLRLSVSAPGPVTPQMAPVISPDGRQIAFVASDTSADAMLWVRSLDQTRAERLPGTNRAGHPFWSPDGQSLGFIADNHLKRIDLATHRVQTLADTVVRWGATWSPQGVILFTTRINELAAVAASGGPVRTILTADSMSALLWPRFLPDGRHFIYVFADDDAEPSGIYAGSIDSPETRLLLQSEFCGWYAPPGYLIYARDEALLAQPFDATRLRLRGEPSVIADGVWFARPALHASFSVSQTGALAYVNATLWDAELAWFDRNGRSLGTGPRIRYEGQTPQISPDGRHIAVARGEFGREDVWLLGTADPSAVRFTFSPDGDGMPVWSADSRQLMFKTGERLFVKAVETGDEEVVMDSVAGLLQDWSRDGRFVVFEQFGSQADLWVVSLDGDRTPVPFLRTPYNEAQAQLSPDGRWIAYTSNETGRDQVYVQAFPHAGRKQQVSSDGGAMPRWRADGKEIFYLAANQYLTAVPVLDSTVLRLGVPVPLFRTRLYVEGSESVSLPTRYDVSPDGERFLIRYPPSDPGPPITVVINWRNALSGQ